MSAEAVSRRTSATLLHCCAAGAQQEATATTQTSRRGYEARLTDEIEALPLEGAAEVLSWLGVLIEQLMREADRILGAQPGRVGPERRRRAGPLSMILRRDRERLGGDGREVGPEAEGNQVSDPGPNRSGRVAAVLSRHPTRGSASCAKNPARVFANPLRASPTAGPCPLRSVSAASPAR